MRIWQSFVVGIGCVALVCLGTSTAFAQNPTVTGIHVNLFKTSAPTVIVASADFLNSAITCGQTPSPPTASTVNPDKVEFTDATDATKVCRVPIGGLIGPLSVDSYVGQANFLYSDGTVGGTSAASNPFTRFLSLVLLGLRFIK